MSSSQRKASLIHPFDLFTWANRLHVWEILHGQPAVVFDQPVRLHLPGNSAYGAEQPVSVCEVTAQKTKRVLPAWRGNDIVQAMIVEGMQYLLEHEMTEARLEVRALNENALNLYHRLGFTVIQQSRFYANDI